MSLNAARQGASPAAAVGAEVFPDRLSPPAEIFLINEVVTPDRASQPTPAVSANPVRTPEVNLCVPSHVGSKHPNEASCLRAVWTYTEFYLIGKACQDTARGYPQGTSFCYRSCSYKLSSLVSGKIPPSVNLCALVLKALREDRNAIEHFHARHVEDSGRLQHGNLPRALA